MAYFIYFLLVISINALFGMWRVNTRKFSWQWFATIHLPVPFIILFRISLSVSLYVIPFGIAAAILGQIAGSKLYNSIKNRP